jgi:hypothetical protein
MITVDQLEVLLRSVPQYLLFAGLSFYIFAWVDKKPKRGLWGELFFIALALASVVVLVSGMIPAPTTEGMVEEHIKMVIKILTLFSAIGLLAAISVILRLWFKKHSRILILVIFGLSIYTFFQSTSMSRIPFELNRPPVTEMPADSVATRAD